MRFLKEAIVLYALFMLAILVVLGTMWLGHRMTVPLFLLTLAVVAGFLISDMTTPLTLSF